MLLYYYVLLVVCSLALAGKDYYKLLGVGKTATDADIKRAFRKLAMKYHPDRNKEPNAESTFREIAEAYEVLSDPSKRRQYDQFGDSTFSQGGNSGFGGSGFNFDFSSFFKEFDESFNARRQGGRQGGGHKFKFGDSFFNFDDLWNDQDGLFGRQAGGNHKPKHPGGGGMFDFDFGDMFGAASSMFGGDSAHHDTHQNIHRSMHKSSHSGHASHGGQTGQSCRTVTQRFGNTVTTFTQCT